MPYVDSDGKCDFDNDFERELGYGPCEGPILQLNDNRGDTVYCERHARLVAAWIKTPHKPGPIWQFTSTLDAAGWDALRAKMQTVDIRDYIPFVPRLTKEQWEQAVLNEWTSDQTER